MSILVNIPDVLTVKEAAQVLKIGRTTMYQLVQSGKIAHIRIGRKVLIPKEYLLRYFEAHAVLCYNNGTDGRGLSCCGKGAYHESNRKP